MKKIKNILNDIKNIFFDNRCIICKSNKLSEKIDIICNDCYITLTTLPELKICQICKHPLKETDLKCPSCSNLKTIYYDNYKFIQYYTGIFKSIVYNWKLEDQFVITILFFKLLIEKNFLDKNIPITIVPDSLFKKIKKGRAGLSYLLKLLKNNGFITIDNIIKRKNFSFQSQKLKDKNHRINEIEKIFYLPVKNKNKYKGEIYLIDDIYTTGSTLNYCSKLLKDAGFNKVYIISFFRTVIEDI